MKDYFHPYTSGSYYHVYHRTGKEVLFCRDEDYQLFLAKYLKYLSPVFSTLAYCLIPNHYHFVVRVRKEQYIKGHFSQTRDSKAIRRYLDDDILVADLISDQFRRLHSSYALIYRNRYRSRGQIFAHRHKHVGIDEERRLLDVICYVHHNPIHHGFTRDFELWPYSSYKAYTTHLESNIDKSWLLERAGSIGGVIELHDQYRRRRLDQ